MELNKFIEQLQNSVDRAETDNWCALVLNAREGEELLNLLKPLLERATIHNSEYLKCKHNNIVAWGPGADKCTDCGLTFEV